MKEAMTAMQARIADIEARLEQGNKAFAEATARIGGLENRILEMDQTVA